MWQACQARRSAKQMEYFRKLKEYVLGEVGDQDSPILLLHACHSNDDSVPQGMSRIHCGHHTRCKSESSALPNCRTYQRAAMQNPVVLPSALPCRRRQSGRRSHNPSGSRSRSASSNSSSSRSEACRSLRQCQRQQRCHVAPASFRIPMLAHQEAFRQAAAVTGRSDA